jgi:single-strand DNA-binding protein
MEIINKVSLVGGQLINNAKCEYVKNGGGKPYVSFLVGIPRVYKKENSHDKDEVFPVVYWGTRAEAIYPVLRKGQIVAIDGALTQESRFDETGRQRSVVRIRASQVLLLEERKIYQPIPNMDKRVKQLEDFILGLGVEVPEAAQ